MYTKNKDKKSDKKYIRISSKRQITIPKKFYYELGFDDQAECILNDGTLTIKPVKQNVGYDFSEEILKDLISQGYSGEKLLKKFKEYSLGIKEALYKLSEEADMIAEGKAEYYTLRDAFPEDYND